MQNQEQRHYHLLWWLVFSLRAFVALVCLDAFLRQVGEVGPHGGWTFSAFAWFSGFVAFTAMTVAIVQPQSVPMLVHADGKLRKLLLMFAQLAGALLAIGLLSSDWTGTFALTACLGVLVLAGWCVQKREEIRAAKDEALSLYPALERELARQHLSFEIDRESGYVYVPRSKEEEWYEKEASSVMLHLFVPPQMPTAEERGIGKMPLPLKLIPREVPSDKERRIGKMPAGVRVLSWREALWLDYQELVAPKEVPPPPPLVLEDVRDRYVPSPTPRCYLPHWKAPRPDERLLEIQDPNLAPRSSSRQKRPPTKWEIAEFRREKIRALLEQSRSVQTQWWEEEQFSLPLQLQDAAD